MLECKCLWHTQATDFCKLIISTSGIQSQDGWENICQPVSCSKKSVNGAIKFVSVFGVGTILEDAVGKCKVMYKLIQGPMNLNDISLDKKTESQI